MPLSELVYTRKGAGETVVLIHGIGHRRQAWNPIFERLAESFDVIAVDLAGFGESPAYAHNVRYNMENACANLSANFESWGVDRPHVVGNSLGGALALELGARDLTASVTAFSPAGFFGWPGRIQAAVMLLPMRLGSLFPLPVLHWFLGFPLGRRIGGAGLYVHPERFGQEDYFGDVKAMRHSSGFERTALSIPNYGFFGHPTAATTIAWGDQDRMLNPKQARTARVRLPEAHHVTLPDCGHVPMVDDPELIIRVIEQTIARAQSTATLPAAFDSDHANLA